MWIDPLVGWESWTLHVVHNWQSLHWQTNIYVQHELFTFNCVLRYSLKCYNYTLSDSRLDVLVDCGCTKWSGKYDQTRYGHNRVTHFSQSEWSLLKIILVYHRQNLSTDRPAYRWPLGQHSYSQSCLKAHLGADSDTPFTQFLSFTLLQVTVL